LLVATGCISALGGKRSAIPAYVGRFQGLLGASLRLYPTPIADGTVIWSWVSVPREPANCSAAGNAETKRPGPGSFLLLIYYWGSIPM
jgi:hypothetical protein